MKIGQKTIVPVPDKKGKTTSKTGVITSIRGNIAIIEVDGDKRAYQQSEIKLL